MLAIDDDVFANAVRTARFFIQRTGLPSGQAVPVEIVDAAAHKAVSQLLDGGSDGERAFYVAEVSRRIVEGLRVQIADEKMLVGDVALDWYVGDRRKKRPLWDRYRKYLALELSFDETTVASIDRSSDRVLEQLGDPTSDTPFDRRGLVVGQVQSGKTTSYSAVINKAIDAGYRVVVVLTGIHESLRVQTQKRLEESVRGIATESRSATGPQKGALLPIALNHPVPDPPHLFTTRALKGDFSADASSFALPTSGTHMFVVKKNATILTELLKHFTGPSFQRIQNPITGALEINKSLLVIDDEADNASVDVGKPRPNDKDHDPTTINGLIRSLLVLFRQRAYVGYTATPYANVLIHKDNETKQEGADLFPKDFIVMLAAPSNYVGPSSFFGGTTADGGSAAASPPLLRFVTDCGCSADPTDWMPRGHKKTHVPSIGGGAGIPASLEDAVMSFVIATSVRHLRGRPKSHNSMLVHVSRFKTVQRLVSAAIGTFVYKLKGALADEAGPSDLPARFERLYTDDFVATCQKMDTGDTGPMPPLAQVKETARDVLDTVKVWTVNSEADAALDYDQFPSGLKVICVGGDKLSRGLTLEGLTVSYFLRASRMYDTLMQMGRWFGYRPGYKDLCRLYLTKELSRWYQHVARADEELRGEFLILQDERRRPYDFGLRVRSHPSLLVTAPGKMASAAEFSLNFGGRVSQTIHFFRDPQLLAQNSRTTSEFLGRIAEHSRDAPALVRRDTTTGAQSGSQPLPGRSYVNVPTSEIRHFLSDYRFHPEARTVAAPQLREFLDRLDASKISISWTVIVASGSAGGTAVTLADGLTVVPVRRATKPEPLREWSDALRGDTLTLGVLASPTDLIADLRESEIEKLKALPPGRLKVDPAEGEHAARSRICKARDEDHCLLVLYVVQPTVTAPKREDGSQPGPVDVQFAPGSALPIGLALALPASERMPPVSYVVNSVLLDELEQEYEEADRQEDGE